jgi:hypothetical protein
VLDRGRIVHDERIEAERGQRSGVVRALRARLLGLLGVDAHDGVYADLVAAPASIAPAPTSDPRAVIAVIHTGRSHAPPALAARSLPLRI